MEFSTIITVTVIVQHSTAKHSTAMPGTVARCTRLSLYHEAPQHGGEDSLPDENLLEPALHVRSLFDGKSRFLLGDLLQKNKTKKYTRTARVKTRQDASKVQYSMYPIKKEKKEADAPSIADIHCSAADASSPCSCKVFSECTLYS